jgi:hypothetical protein
MPEESAGNKYFPKEFISQGFAVLARRNLRRLQLPCGLVWLSQYSDSLWAGRSRDRIPVEGEIFCTRANLPWGAPSLLYNWYRVLRRVKAAGTWRWPPTPPVRIMVKERVELYLYSPSVPLWPVLWNTTFNFCNCPSTPKLTSYCTDKRHVPCSPAL